MISYQPDIGRRFLVLVEPDNDHPNGPVLALESEHRTFREAQAALERPTPIWPAAVASMPRTAPAARIAAAHAAKAPPP